MMCPQLSELSHCLMCVLKSKVTTVCILAISIFSLERSWGPITEYLFQHTLNENDSSQQLCTNQNFILDGMSACHPWLTCHDIKTDLVVTDSVIGEGAEKVVKEGIWQGHKVAVNFLRHHSYSSDFHHNLEMLQLFSEKPGAEANKVVQLVGWCFEDASVIVTELHPYGSANNIHSILREQFSSLDSLKFRFEFCIEFVQILDILHSHRGGPRVLCDANDPQKALSQILVTKNLTFVLNDMDALPVVDKASGHFVKCGHKELGGDFVAPEQLWPHDTIEYDDNLMPHYDEKIDIWKIPDICGALLGSIVGLSKIQLQLFNIHSQCKITQPEKRPSAREVLKAYKYIRENLT